MNKTTPTPDRVTHHLDCVPQRFQVMPEYQGIIQLARELQHDLAIAQEELRAIGDHVGGGAFYRNEYGGRLPLRDQVGQHIAELNQQLAAAREVLASKDARLASVKAHAEAMRDWIRVREWTTAEPIALVVAYDRAAHLKDAP